MPGYHAGAYAAPMGAADALTQGLRLTVAYFVARFAAQGRRSALLGSSLAPALVAGGAATGTPHRLNAGSGFD